MFPDVKFDECALCGESSDLQLSHIVPGFVFRWFRESSATGHMRFGEVPNVRTQDGLKLRMLCHKCEQLFSPWEKNFCENCFGPINDGCAEHLPYGAWMLKCATSISWRVLRVFAASNELFDSPPRIHRATSKALHGWASFLKGNKAYLGRHEQHMFSIDAIREIANRNGPPNINRYLNRAIEIHVAHDNTSSFSYTKMGKLILFGFIDMRYSHNWRGTKLNTEQGRVRTSDIDVPADILEYIYERARRSAARYTQISESQQTKIRQSYEKDMARATNSDTLRAMHQDVLLFGKSAFEFTQASAKATTKESGGENSD